jgi:outer membrane protein
MKHTKLSLLSAAIAALLAGPVNAADLLETYRLARQYDPVFSAARYQRDAGLERLPQALAGLLPTVTASANTNWNDARNVTNDRTFKYNSNGWLVQLTQPLFRWQNFVQYGQAQWQVQQAEAQFGQAQQDLIVRTAQAYFDVLAAQDNLAFVKANKVAIGEQLAQAKRNFEVGTATITDTNEAQARFDLANAQEISAINDLEVRQRALQAIIGSFPATLSPLRSKFDLTPPEPNDMNKWVESSLVNNFAVKANEAAYEIAEREVSRQRAGHYPTVDLVGSTAQNTAQNVALLTGTRSTVDQSIIGVQVNVPLFAGWSVTSKTREANFLREKAQQDLESARRQAEFNTRQSFLGVTNGMAQVRALEQALQSSEVSLQSNRVGYEVGVRINIDVLNAQQQVFQTLRDLSRSRYDTIVNGLKLKAAAGTLTETDVEQVNLLLAAAGTPTMVPGTNETPGQLMDQYPKPPAPKSPPAAPPKSGAIDPPTVASETPLSPTKPAKKGEMKKRSS